MSEINIDLEGKLLKTISKFLNMRVGDRISIKSRGEVVVFERIR